jgi:hypothetical protein
MIVVIWPVGVAALFFTVLTENDAQSFPLLSIGASEVE